MSTLEQSIAEHPGLGFTYYGRWLGRCKHCKGLVKVELAAADAQPGWHIGHHQRLVECPHGCVSRSNGRPLYVALKGITGSLSDRRCNATCLNAKGPSCDCSCGGRNHGAGS